MSTQNLNQSRAVFAGGCFWGMQDLMRKLPGVINTRVGYTGGSEPNATYKTIMSGKSRHAEAIELIYDNSQISYRKLLEVFFQIHDPSTFNQQGNDRGSQYRSAIFYINEEQERQAKQIIAEIDASGIWPGKVVTEVTAASDFWEAESEHRDYLQRYPHGYTCHFPRPDWKLTA